MSMRDLAVEKKDLKLFEQSFIDDEPNFLNSTFKALNQWPESHSILARHLPYNQWPETIIMLSSLGQIKPLKSIIPMLIGITNNLGEPSERTHYVSIIINGMTTCRTKEMEPVINFSLDLLDEHFNDKDKIIHYLYNKLQQGHFKEYIQKTTTLSTKEPFTSIEIEQALKTEKAKDLNFLCQQLDSRYSANGLLLLATVINNQPFDAYIAEHEKENILLNTHNNRIKQVKKL